MMWMLTQLWHLPRNTLVLIMRLYQFALSPDHSFWAKAVYPEGYCKFYPSCSEYGIKSIKKHGVIIGFIKAGWRILRCNPWSEGGVDEPS